MLNASQVLPSGYSDTDPNGPVANYASCRLFGQPAKFFIFGNPYRRPVRPQDIETIDFSRRLSREDYPSAAALTGQRLLTNIYESDLLFLPSGDFRRVERDFQEFYSDKVKLAGEQVRPLLERQLFSFLEEEIDVSGRWTEAAMRAYFQQRLESITSGESSPLCETIEGAKDPQAAADVFLTQLASDFLSEASAMARNVLGSFGPAQSELFKVLIDEYGYGVHDTKHSTLFEETLKSRNLAFEPHAYWQFYLGTSLSLVTYFHYVSRNHSLYFRYLGALLFTEATLPWANRLQSEMLQRVFGKTVDTRYFDEHVHIDVHHARMALDKIIVPTVEQCGERVIPEIVRGFEEFALLQELADSDLMAQIEWSDTREHYVERARALQSEGAAQSAGALFRESEGELSVPHVHNEDELFLVEEGALDFATGPGTPRRLHAGEGILIPRGRHHGTRVVSEHCTYRAVPLRGESGC